MRTGGGFDGSLGAVAVDEVFARKCHAVLDRDTAAKGFDTLQFGVANRFGVVDGPSGGKAALFIVHLLKDIHDQRDAVAIGSVLAQRPAGLDQLCRHLVQVFFGSLTVCLALF